MSVSIAKYRNVDGSKVPIFNGIETWRQQPRRCIDCGEKTEGSLIYCADCLKKFKRD